MKNNVKIAVLDTGLNAVHPYLIQNVRRCYDIVEKTRNYEVVLLENNNYDNNGHGTACASVIKSFCSSVDIYSFKILDEKGICNVLKLETVLSYIEQTDIDIINLSLSIIENTNITELKNICNRLRNKNKLVIASLGNEQKKGYPAMLKSCIGVQGFILESIDSIWFCKYKKIQCVVDSTPFLHCDKEGNYSMFGKCNSYSAAKLSGIVASIVKRRAVFDIEEIIVELTTISERSYWNQLVLQRSKRFPNVVKYKGNIDAILVKEVEKIVKEYFQLEKNISLDKTFLFSKEVGLTYECCYELLRVLEKKIGFIVSDYTNISREDFYSIYNIAQVIQYYK